jgi:hypothetical protein
VCGSDGFDAVVGNIKTARDHGALLTAVYTLSIHNQADWINAPRFFHDLGVYYTANFDSLNPGLFVNEKGAVINPLFQAFLDEHFKYFISLRQNTLPLIMYNGEKLLVNLDVRDDPQAEAKE